MRFFSTLTAFLTLSLASIVLAGPTPLKTVERFQGAETSGKYIVQFKKGVVRKNWLSKLSKGSKAASWDLINGIAVDVDEAELNELRASTDVESISEDPLMSIFATQTNATWGLQRITQTSALTNQNAGSTTFTYTYDDSAGQGVDIYIVDTGVLTTHREFGGRARWGTSFVGTSSDGHGHGTHVAGTAAGTTYGVAKKANIIAVQVLNSSGSGSTSGIVSGLNWVLTQARASGRPSIVSMSLGGSAATSLDNAVASLTSAGIHVVVAAGNSNTNAANTSPARAPSAITVGATTVGDARASYSNYGAVVDVFGPGSNVISSWIGSSNTATNSISGTSMATPHVAGVAAYLISKDGNVSPAALETKIKNLSTKNAISGIPSGTVNNLVHI
ncbi:serine protease [Coprinellus micaceus]|uniref:Serine protease n=1 Tax=Coprinellus micaceus TaxID=71717 RepID=A0A4Y7SHI3_COPMI|nr:serine protease [Coprinellus micaceus]